MKALVICAILLVAAFATSDSDAMDTIHRLENSKNGKRILDTIAL